MARLHEHVAWGREQADITLSNLTDAFAKLGSDASVAATKQLALMARREALVMALGDVFVCLTVLFLALVAVTPLMRRPAPRGGGGGAH